MSLSDSKPHQAVGSQRIGGNEELASQHKELTSGFVPATSRPYELAILRSLEIQLATVWRDEALVAWLASRRYTKNQLDDSSSAETWTRDETGDADDLKVNSVERVFALFASS